MKSRKGSTKDLFAGLKTIGPVIVGLFIFGAFYFQFVEILMTIEILQPWTSRIFGRLNTAILALDYFAPLLMAGLIAGSLYLAHRIPANPIFMPFSIFMGLAAIYMSGQLSNLWIEMARAPIVSAYTGRFGNTEALLLHIPEMIGFWWILLVGVMYKKGRTAQTGGVSNPIR